MPVKGNIQRMKNGVILGALIGLLLSALLLLRPDPWAQARAVARADAADMAAVLPQDDLIGIRIAEHGALRQLALWDEAGALLYPLPDTFSPLKTEFGARELADIRAVLEDTTQDKWTRFDHEGRHLLYCQRTPAACLVYDRMALAEQMGVISLGATSTAPVRISALGIAVTSLIALGATLWRRRVRARTGFEFLPDQFCARRDGRHIPLSKRDTKIMALLLARAGGVVTRDELYDEGWGRDFMPNSRALDQHIINLRRKLNPDKNCPELIETVRGIGYRFVG
jgi:hypothetical protein